MAFPEELSYASRFFPHEEAFTLPRKCISLGFEDRARKLPDTAHDSEIYGDLSGKVDRRQVNKQIEPYVFTALEEFSRPLAFLRHELDRREENADDNRRSQKLPRPKQPPLYRSTCPSIDNLGSMDMDLEEASPLLGVVEGPSRPRGYHGANVIDRAGYGPQGDLSSREAAPLDARFLRNYHPTYRPEGEVQRKLQRLEELKVLLKERPTGYQWLTLEFQGFSFPNPPAEPLFVSMALYYVDATTERNRQRLLLCPETSGRVSEAIHFDVATDDVRQSFPSMYRAMPRHRPGDLSCVLEATPPGLDGKDLVKAFRNGQVENEEFVNPPPDSPLTEVRAGAIMVPRNKEFRNPSLLLVVQVFKVLQGDPDKTHDAYRVLGRGRANSQQLQADAERLGKFVQPLGMSFFPLYNQEGELQAGVEASPEAYLPGASASCIQSRPLCRTKVGLTDSEIMQLALDADAASGDEVERLNGLVRLRVSEVGESPEFPTVEDGPPPFRVIDPHLTHLTSESSDGASAPSTPIRELVRFPLVCYGDPAAPAPPSRIRVSSSLSPDLVQQHLAMGYGSSSPTPEDGSRATAARARVRDAEVHLTTHPHGFYHNLLFVQPEELGGFRHRNLAVRVELRDLRALGPEGEVAEGGMPLRAVFNTKSGPTLVTEQTLPVTYHSRAPGLSGQVKIALPLRLRPSSLLYFTVFHVHVKDKNAKGRSAGWSGIFKGRSASDAGGPFRAADAVARGWIPLINPQGAGSLVENGYHTIRMEAVRGGAGDDDEDGASDPVNERASSSYRSFEDNPAAAAAAARSGSGLTNLSLRVLLRSASSVHPSDPGLAALLSTAPGAMGWLSYPPDLLPSTNVGEGHTDLANLSRTLEHGPSHSGAESLGNALRQCVADTSPRQTCEFLLVTLRLLFRILCAGTGEGGGSGWRDPNKFPKLRCDAFWLLPLLLERAAQAMGAEAKGEEGSSRMPEFLHAYVELLYLEEVPEGRTADNHMPTPRGDGMRTRSDVEVDSIAEVVAEKIFNSICEASLTEILVAGATEAAGRHARAARAAPSPAPKAPFPTSPRGGPSGIANSIYKKGPPSGRAAAKAAKGLQDALKVLADQHSYEATAEVASWHLLGSISAPDDLKWWPWIYEVIITQWHAVLNILQNPQGAAEDLGEGAGGALAGVAEGDEEDASTTSADDAAFYPHPAHSFPGAFRPALARHAPFLLKLILKSLALRLCYEGLDPPVMLDNSTSHNLTSLCSALGVEVMSLPLWQRQALNAAMADFFREFMTLVHPEQVGRSLRAYLRVLKKHSNVEDFELRLDLLERLSLYDHFVVINSPHSHPGGAKLSPHRLRVIVTGLADETGGHQHHTLTKLSSTPSVGSMEVLADLPNHWLAELVITEVMGVLNLPTAETHVRENAVAVLRQLFVGHSYDPRYQDDLSRRRIANMYLPLLGKAVDAVEKLADMAPFAVARRDLCACLLFLLQDAPMTYLSDIFREMCFPGHAEEDPDVGDGRGLGGGETTGSYWGGTKSSPSHAELLDSAKVATVLHSHSGVGVLAQRMLHLLRLCLDTFEYPGHAGAGSNLVPGAVGTDEDGRNRGPTGRSALTALDSMMKHSRRTTGSPSKIHSSLQRRIRQRTKKRSFAGKKKTIDAHVESVRVSSITTTPMQVLDATKRQCHVAMGVVHRAAFLLMDEAARGIFGGGGLEFMEEIHIYLLHALDMAASDLVLVAVLQEIKSLLHRFGALLFFLSMGDAMQDYCRRLLFLCNARAADVRHAAVSTLVYIWESYDSWEAKDEGGMRTPLLAVAPQVYTELAGPTCGALGRHASDATYPHPISSKADVRKAFLPFRVSLKELAVWREDADGHVPERLRGDLVALSRTLSALLDAFFADHLVLAEMELAGTPRTQGSGGGSHTPPPPPLPIRSPNFTGSPTLGAFGYAGKTVADATRVLDEAGEDAFMTQRTLLRAADAFSTSCCPHLRVYYLRRLAALHATLGNPAEASSTMLAAADTIAACRPLLLQDRLWAPQPFCPRIDGHFTAPSGTTKAAHRNRGLECNVRGPPNNPFATIENCDAEYQKCVEDAAYGFCAIPLPLHAVGAFARLTPRLAEARDLAKLGETHQKMTAAFAIANNEEYLWRKAGEFANMGFAEGGGMRKLGVFYRVLVFGTVPSSILGRADVPAAHVESARLLRGVRGEFVYRFPPLVQLVTAKKSISDLLNHEIAALCRESGQPMPPLEILPDRADEAELLKRTNEPNCYLKITVVRPVPPQVARTDDTLRSGDGELEIVKDAGGGHGSDSSGASDAHGEEYSHFEFSIPFTPSGKSQGSTAQQCKKRTYLTVKGSFPTVVTRLPVGRRRTMLLSPLDCAADDLRQRSIQMKMELARRRDDVDKQALKGLVGGSVIPQVNGGALEIAETFLSRANAATEVPLVASASELEAKRVALAGELRTFLGLCEQLVVHTRHVLGITDKMILNPPSDADGEVVEKPDVTWQREVERGLARMQTAMKPMLTRFGGEADVLREVAMATAMI